MKAVIVLGCCLAFCAGCQNKDVAPPAAQEAKAVPVLKQFIGRTDIVKVKHFFTPAELFAKDAGEYISPGHMEIEPAIVYEPGKESTRIKGLRVEVVSTYFRENSYSHPDKDVAFLDEDEAKDFAVALKYLQQMSETWKNAEPTDDVEVMFASKDNFSFSLLPEPKKGNVLFAEIGNASVSFPVSMIGEVQNKMELSLAVLSSNEK